jgi:hypothetical protein
MINRKILSFILIALIATTSFAGKIETVIVEGYGATVESAQANAGKAAVSQVVGMYTVSSSAIENRKLIKDEVLSYSNGYIKTFKVIDTKQQDGLYVVEAKVEVEIGKLTQMLGKLNIALKNVNNVEFKVKTKQAFASSKNFAKLFDEVVLIPIVSNQNIHSLEVLSMELFDEESVGRNTGSLYQFGNNSYYREKYDNGELLPFLIKFKSTLSDEYVSSVAKLLQKTARGIRENCRGSEILCIKTIKSNGKINSVGFKFSKVNNRLIANRLSHVDSYFVYKFKLVDKAGDEIGVLVQAATSSVSFRNDFIGPVSPSNFVSSNQFLYGSSSGLPLKESVVGIDIKKSSLSLVTNDQIFATIILLSEEDAERVDKIEFSVLKKVNSQNFRPFHSGHN